MGPKLKVAFAIAVMALLALTASAEQQQTMYEHENDYRHGECGYVYNMIGADTEGYDRHGYDKYGYDRHGYDKDGYHQHGHHKDGYDSEGYDKYGFDREGHHSGGYDRSRYLPVKHGLMPDGGPCFNNYGCCSHLCVSKTCVPRPPSEDVCIGSPGVNPPDTTGWNCTGAASFPAGTICTAECNGGSLLELKAVCASNGSWVQEGPTSCITSCFSGSAQVVVKEDGGKPVAMRDLHVGQQVLCYDGGDDLMAAGTARWCEVKNFARAEETMFDDMVRINFTHHDGTRGSTTMAQVHIVHVLKKPPTEQATFTTAVDLGPFTLELAANVKAGQWLAVATAWNETASFIAAVVKSVEFLSASGKYTPAIEQPYLLVDGVVVPLWTAWGIGFLNTTGSPDALHLANTFRHYFMAPLWMTNVQPRGTPGQKATWDSNSRPAFVKALYESLAGKGPTPVTGPANFTKAQEWFLPRYAAWKADPSKVITVADVLDAWPRMFVGDKASVVTAAAGQSAASVDATVEPFHVCTAIDSCGLA